MRNHFLHIDIVEARNLIYALESRVVNIAGVAYPGRRRRLPRLLEIDSGYRGATRLCYDACELGRLHGALCSADGNKNSELGILRWNSSS